MKTLTQTEKDTIYWMVHRCVEADGGREKIMTGRACLNWMIHGAVILHQCGIETIPQAGSASFRFLPEHLDDGVCDTHHSFMWSPYTPQSQAKIAEGQLPEIHCWLADPKTREIIDFSTGYIHHSFNQPWLADPLPRYLWRREGDPHPGCCYQPYPQAIQFILNFMRQKAYANATTHA